MQKCLLSNAALGARIAVSAGSRVRPKGSNPIQATEPSIPPGSVNWCKTCLKGKILSCPSPGDGGKYYRANMD